MTTEPTPARLVLDEESSGLVRLDVVQVAHERQQPGLVAAMTSFLEQRARESEIHSGAVLRGTGGRDVALICTEVDDGPTTPAVHYTIEIVDRLTDERRSIIEAASDLFHFVNVFQVAEGKRDEMIEYFRHTIPFVRKQPGYISTNLLVSLDGRQAANVGQYRTRADFLAIFRQPDVLGSFARGYPKRIMTPRWWAFPQPPRLRLYELTTVISGHLDDR